MKVKEDAVIISQYRFRDWILDAFWRESSAALHLDPRVVYLFSSKKNNLLMGKNRSTRRVSSRPILSIHQSNLMLLKDMESIQYINQHNILVTHFNSQEEPVNLIDYYRENDRARFLVMNTNVKTILVSKGMPSEKVSVIYGAVDKKIYYPGNANFNGDYILIAGDCKPRKNPAMVCELILANPNLKFVFESMAWKRTLYKIEQLHGNISYWDSKNMTKGDLYRNASALCNLSFVEGGPISVLQALASGTPILSSDVGFVSEVLPQGFGELITLDLSIEQISDTLRRVASRKRLVSTLDGLIDKFGWEDLGRNLFTFID